MNIIFSFPHPIKVITIWGIFKGRPYLNIAENLPSTPAVTTGYFMPQMQQDDSDFRKNIV